MEVLELPTGLFWTSKNYLRQKRTRKVYSVSPLVEFYRKPQELSSESNTIERL